MCIRDSISYDIILSELSALRLVSATANRIVHYEATQSDVAVTDNSALSSDGMRSDEIGCSEVR